MSFQHDFDEARLRAQLAELPRDARIAFALACAERMRAVYQQYADRHDAASGVEYRRLLDVMWRSIETRDQPGQHVLGIVEKAMALLPTNADSADVSTIHAEDAAAAHGAWRLARTTR